MKRRPPPVDAPAGPFNPGLAALRDRLPAAPPAAEPARPPQATPRPAAPVRPPPPRAVVRLERKGRGGKEATVIEKLALPPAALAEWGDALKRALGCGGAIEGGALVVQGDQRERVRRWLEGRGVARIVVA